MTRIKRAAAEQGINALENFQKIAKNYEISGELKKFNSSGDFDLRDCADDWNNYEYGSILRIRLINFQKYSDCTIKPGPFMNMVMGPNGTGKSTIVAAIALGLGAGTGVLGRSKDVAEYIKYGTEESSIELILKCQKREKVQQEKGNDAGNANVDAEDGGSSLILDHEEERQNGKVLDKFTTERPFVTIRRTLKKTGSSSCESIWRINDQIAGQRTVSALANRLNAQVGNLCQFLPQDKVSEFARMSPTEMLTATLKAAAPEEVSFQLNQLIELRRDDREHLVQLESDRNQLELDQRMLSGLQEQMQRAQERQEKVDRIGYLERKRPWLFYQKYRQDFLQLKADRVRLREEIEATALESNAELRTRLNSSETHITALRSERAKLMKSYSARKKSLERFSEQLTTHATLIDSKRQSIERTRKKMSQRAADFEEVKRELRELEAKIRGKEQTSSQSQNPSYSPSLSSPDRALSQVLSQIHGHEMELKESATLEEQLKVSGQRNQRIIDESMRKLSDLEDWQKRSLEALKTVNPAAFHASEWLAENRHRFSGPIMGPLALELTLSSPSSPSPNAAANLIQVVESVISRSILVSFICVNARDQELFLSLCEERRWSVNVSLLEGCEGVSQNSLEVPNCPWDRGELKRLGFDGVISDYLQAPPLVKRALTILARAHLIPVRFGSGEGIDIASCQKVHDLVKFASSDSFFEIRHSRYGDGEVAVRSAPLKPPFLLSRAASTADLESEQSSLRDRIQGCRQTLQRHENEMRALLQGRSEHQNQMSSLKARERAIRDGRQTAAKLAATLNYDRGHRDRLLGRVRDLQDLLNEGEVDGFRESDLLADFKELIVQRAGLLSKFVSALKEFNELRAQVTKIQVSLTLESVELSRLQHQKDRQSSRSEALQLELQLAEEKCLRAKERAQEALDEAQVEEITAEMKEIFEGLPNDLNELERELDSERGRLNAMGSGVRFGPRDMEEYNSRQSSKQALEAKIRDHERALQRLQNQLTQMGTRWKETVNEVISKINEGFSNFFQRIGCFGEVLLGGAALEPAGQLDFDRYELWIRVAFRPGEALQRLSAQRQSGGEKSVSTILFLLSLQELSRAPFRVVDEINQGMDVENERKIHTLIVEVATKQQASKATTTNPAKSNSAQYFLISPKLLTGLSYHSRMHILCIYNGLGVEA